jgi:3-oxoacyl-[acyl-carrier protein] reductase
MIKTVIVTGASRGLGLAICKKLSEEGYYVIAVARTFSLELQSLCSSRTVSFEEFDFANIDNIREWFLSIVQRYGRIYGLVNNAAIGNDGVLGTMHERDIATTLLVNLQSPIVLTKYVTRSMLLRGSGRIVNITSIIATTGFNGLSVYAASKAGLVGFTKSLAREVGKAGITVNCVAPGYMETDMTSGMSSDKLASIRRRSPSGKLVTVDSVAEAVLFLIGETGESINGTTLTVDAGSTA